MTALLRRPTGKLRNPPNTCLRSRRSFPERRRMRRSYKRRILQRPHPFRGLRKLYKARHERLWRLLRDGAGRQRDSRSPAPHHCRRARQLRAHHCHAHRQRHGSSVPGASSRRTCSGEPGRFRARAAEYLSGRDQGRAGDFWGSGIVHLLRV